MDVTPHDLRNAELREAFRGYRPDEVEELLERAALTLERMHERNRQLQEKMAALEAEGSSAKEMETVLRQTLLLAQRTADETVTSAHEKARQLVESAEDRSLSLTSEAEEQARIVGEAQRQKYEAIVAELSARRELLIARHRRAGAGAGRLPRPAPGGPGEGAGGARPPRRPPAAAQARAPRDRSVGRAGPARRGRARDSRALGACADPQQQRQPGARHPRRATAARPPRRWSCSTRNWLIRVRPERAPAAVPKLRRYHLPWS